MISLNLTQRTMRAAIITLLLILPFSPRLSAQEKAMSIRDQLQLVIPSNAIISPDGEHCVYTVRLPDMESNKWITQIFLFNVKSKSAQQITTSTANATSPAWSPDGKTITFLSRRSYLDAQLHEQKGVNQLFALSMNGGEAQALTSSESDVEEYAWSPDGKSIYFLTEAEAIASTDNATKKLKTNARASSEPKPGKILWQVSIGTESVRKISEVDRGVTSLNVAQDGKSVLYQTNYTGEYNDEQKYDIWVISDEGQKRQITNAAGPETKPVYAPDGKRIACITQTVPDIEFAETDANIMDTDGKNAVNLTKDFDYSVKDIQWESSGQSLLLTVDEKTNTFLYRYDVKKKTLTNISITPGSCSNISIAKNTGAICALYESASKMNEIAFVEPKGIRIVSDFTAQLTNAALATTEVISYPSRDGKFTIEGVLVKPKNYDAAKKYPMVLCYHGGPYGHFKNNLIQRYAVHQLASEGFVCFLPNVRGSSGYSDAFSQANRYDLGGGDYEDAMAGVDMLITKGIVDGTRMAVMGGSYGGYLTNWTISQTQRFKAAISMYGIFSWFTDWSNSFQPAFEKMYFGYYYWDKPLDRNNLYIARAPQTFVKNITTPTLILQGTEDEYTNIANSREMYQALKELGRTVEFITYEGEGHGLRNKPNNYIDSIERTVQWMKKHVLEGKD